jgi:hypothetical protein
MAELGLTWSIRDYLQEYRDFWGVKPDSHRKHEIGGESAGDWTMLSVAVAAEQLSTVELLLNRIAGFHFHYKGIEKAIGLAAYTNLQACQDILAAFQEHHWTLTYQDKEDVLRRIRSTWVEKDHEVLLKIVPSNVPSSLSRRLQRAIRIDDFKVSVKRETSSNDIWVEVRVAECKYLPYSLDQRKYD